jgi:hypothetical protein
LVGTIFIRFSGMGEGSVLITGIVALCAICAKLPGKDRRFGGTGRAR